MPFVAVAVEVRVCEAVEAAGVGEQRIGGRVGSAPARGHALYDLDRDIECDFVLDRVIECDFVLDREIERDFDRVIERDFDLDVEVVRAARSEGAKGVEP